jgi:hypothetical protein
MRRSIRLSLARQNPNQEAARRNGFVRKATQHLGNADVNTPLMCAGTAPPHGRVLQKIQFREESHAAPMKYRSEPTRSILVHQVGATPGTRILQDEIVS